MLKREKNKGIGRLNDRKLWMMKTTNQKRVEEAKEEKIMRLALVILLHRFVWIRIKINIHLSFQHFLSLFYFNIPNNVPIILVLLGRSFCEVRSSATSGLEIPTLFFVIFCYYLHIRDVMEKRFSKKTTVS